MQAENEFVLSSGTAKIKDCEYVFDEIYSEHYAVKLLPGMALTEFVLNEHGASIIMEFDPGGISFICMVKEFSAHATAINNLCFDSEGEYDDTLLVIGWGTRVKVTALTTNSSSAHGIQRSIPSSGT
ncbi:hypothetical protein KSP40_PGU022687 [Platanthera guangdongensis]|uniref:Uncharacterized protein n=1 Tax=Platanthera guangdongensis TaxID=2320717 RepID=A0ABR2M5L2_9ASPA